MAFGDASLTAAVMLLQCGPPLVLYICLIAPRSLLTMVTLASAFVWASVLLLLSPLLRGLLADDASPARFAVIVVIAVAFEEAVRWWLYRIHRRASHLLEDLATKNPSWRFGPADEVLLAFAIGYGQAVAHALVFSVSWLPLTGGKGVLYAGACRSMSHAPAAALMMLGLFFLHAGSTVVAFDGRTHGNLAQAASPGVVHLLAALLTVLNTWTNSCAGLAAVEIAVGVAMLACTFVVYQRRCGAAPLAYVPVRSDSGFAACSSCS